MTDIVHVLLPYQLVNLSCNTYNVYTYTGIVEQDQNMLGTFVHCMELCVKMESHMYHVYILYTCIQITDILPSYIIILLPAWQYHNLCFKNSGLSYMGMSPYYSHTCIYILFRFSICSNLYMYPS